MRMDQLDNLLETENISFFKILRENFRDKITFDLNHPVESIFLYNAMQESNEEETGTVLRDLFNEILSFITSLIEKYQQKGEINPLISAEIAAHFIFQSQLGIYEYLANFKGVSFKESIKSGQLFSFPETEIMHVVDEILLIIKSGLKA